MENLKLISARIDPVTLRSLDEFQKKHYYWKRNTIINGILSAVVDGFSDKDIFDMVQYCRGKNTMPSGSFSSSQGK